MMMTYVPITILMIMVLALFAMNGGSEFAYATTQRLANWTNSKKREFDYVVFETESGGGNEYYSGGNSYGETAQNYDPVGGIDIAAEERGYHRAPNGNEMAAKTLVSTIGVNGRNSATAGVDQCDAAYLGAERTFDAYGGYANVGTSTVQHSRVLYSQTISEETQRYLDELREKREREESRTPLQKFGETAIGLAVFFGVIFGVWAIFHFIF